LNIDDLWRDICEECDEYEEGEMTDECRDMIRIANLYEEGKRRQCAELIEEFRDKYGYKINIL